MKGNDVNVSFYHIFFPPHMSFDLVGALVDYGKTIKLR